MIDICRRSFSDGINGTFPILGSEYLTNLIPLNVRIGNVICTDLILPYLTIRARIAPHNAPHLIKQLSIVSGRWWQSNPKTVALTKHRYCTTPKDGATSTSLCDGMVVTWSLVVGWSRSAWSWLLRSWSWTWSCVWRPKYAGETKARKLVLYIWDEFASR
jgi:hypothetical protein